MKIKINNFFKLKKPKKVRKQVDKLEEKAFKVYSTGGNVIKYQPYKNKVKNTEIRVRNGARNVSQHSLVEDNKSEDRIIKKYKSDENIEKISNNTKSANILFFFMIALAGGSLYLSYTKNRELYQEDFAVYNSENSIVLNEDVASQNSLSNNLDVRVKDNIKNSNSVKVEKQVKKQEPKVEPLNFSRPVLGEVIKIYSKDKVIYSKTLEVWKTHEGIDVKTDENVVVKSIEKGTVEKIYDDSFYGKTIIIDHGQGYKSCYSNLAEEVFVKEKQVISKLTKIGKVGKTAIGEIKDESHLHFTLIKNNEICDPTSIFS